MSVGQWQMPGANRGRIDARQQQVGPESTKGHAIHALVGRVFVGVPPSGLGVGQGGSGRLGSGQSAPCVGYAAGKPHGRLAAALGAEQEARWAGRPAPSRLSTRLRLAGAGARREPADDRQDFRSPLYPDHRTECALGAGLGARVRAARVGVCRGRYVSRLPGACGGPLRWRRALPMKRRTKSMAESDRTAAEVACCGGETTAENRCQSDLGLS